MGSPCLMELQTERLPALVGKTVYVDELGLDEFAEILEMEAETEADELYVGDLDLTFDTDLIRSIWISRSGDVRPSRSYANLVEMISCEEAGTDQTRLSATESSSAEMLSRFLSDAVLGENDSVGKKSGRHDNASDAVFFRLF